MDDKEDDKDKEEVAKIDQQPDKKKSNWQKMKKKVSGAIPDTFKPNKRVGPVPTGEGSRRTSSDSSTSDVSSPHEMPTLVEERSDSPQTEYFGTPPAHVAPLRRVHQHGYNSATVLSHTHTSPATTVAAHSTAGHSSTHDYLPLDSKVQGHEPVIQGQKRVQPSETNFIAIPEKSKDQPMSGGEFKLMQENANLNHKLLEMEKKYFTLNGEKDTYARQLAVEKRERSEEKEDARRALADAERRLAQEKGIVQAKTNENSNLIKQLQLKEDYHRQLEEQVAQREREILNVHEHVKQIKAHHENQLQEAQQESKSYQSELSSLKQQVAKLQSHQHLKDLAADVNKREEHIRHLKDAIALLNEKLCDAQTEVQKKAKELTSNQELVAKTKRAERQMAAAMAQEVQKCQDLTRRFAKETTHSAHLQEMLQKKEEVFSSTIEKMKREMAAMSARIEVSPSLTGSEVGGANASSGPSSLEEEQKKIVLFEDNMKVKDEELQRLRQEKMALERDLADEKVAKNHLESEKMRLTAELQKMPDHTAMTAQVAENEKDLQHFRLENEHLKRKMYELQQKHGHAIPQSHNGHILQEKEDKILELENALRREKQTLLDLNETLQEKEETVLKLEADLRESRKENEVKKEKEKQSLLEVRKTLQEKEEMVRKLEEDLRENRKDNERENKENEALQVRENHIKILEKKVTELEESLEREKENVLTLKDEKKVADSKAAAEMARLKASHENLQNRIAAKEGTYKREVELHEEALVNLEKAREKAKLFGGIADSQRAELTQLRQQLEQTEQQMQLDRTAQDETIAKLKHETNEIRERMKEQYTLVSTELTSAMECVNSKETKLDQLKANVKKLENDLAMSKAQAVTYKADFEEERRDRERIKGQVADVEERATAATNKLHSAISELNTQNQQLRTRLEEVLNENRHLEEKLKEGKANKRAILKQVDELKEELKTSQAQIRGYKTQSDGLKKELEESKQANKRKDEALQRSCEIQQKVADLEKELDSEKKSHEHFRAAFGTATAIGDQLRANNAQLEEKVRYQSAQLANYQARAEAKRSKARQVLSDFPGSQPLPGHFPVTVHLPPSNTDYEVERGWNSGEQQVMSGHGEAAAVRSRSNQGHVQGSSANSRRQQLQPGISQPYPQHPQHLQQQPQLLHLQEVASAGQGYNRSGPSSLGNTSLSVHESGHTNLGLKAHSSNVAFSQPTQVSDPTPQPAQQVIHSNVNTPYPKKNHSQAPSQFGHTNVGPSALQKTQPSSNAAYFQHPTQLPASQQTSQRAQDNRQLPMQGISPSQPVKKSSDDQATLAENPLMDNIDQDIEEVAGEVRHMSGPPPTTEHRLQGEQGFEIPIDPNLVCSKCGIVFRHGEIQKLRKHYDQCNGRQR